jgi:hypothetical protein
VLFMGYVKRYGTDGQIVDGNIIRRMRFACSITKTTDTLAECVILVLTALPRQRWLRECASVLHLCVSVHCLSR